MTYAELCHQLSAITQDTSEAAAEARAILFHIYQATPSDIAMNPTCDYDTSKLLTILQRRQSHEPLAYIIGNMPFWKQEYLVTPDCLIPRADTEILVEKAIQILPPHSSFVDLCAGSGCVGISILGDRPDLKCFAVEIQPQTAALAKQNAQLNQVEQRYCISVDDALSPYSLLEDAPLGGLVANPPYIESNTIDSLSLEVHHEPRIALDGGIDGLDFYRGILSSCHQYLAPGAPILFEIGYNQGAAVTKLAFSHGRSCQIIKDYNGLDRVAILTNNE